MSRQTQQKPPKTRRPTPPEDRRTPSGHTLPY